MRGRNAEPATVTRVTALGLFVELEDPGAAGVEFGPCPVLEPISLTVTTSAAGAAGAGGTHTHQVVVKPQVGDRVLVLPQRGTPEDLVVLGRLP